MPEEEWEEPYEWSPRELITAAKLNITTKNLRWLKQRLEEAPPAIHDKASHKSPTLPDDDIHRTSVPIDHPDSSITPPKLSAVNVPEDGQVPSFHAATGQFAWITPAVGVGPIKKVAEVVLDTDVTYVDFTGLDLNRDKFYLMLYSLRSAAFEQYFVFFNQDFAPGNYSTQWVFGEGGSVMASRVYVPIFAMWGAVETEYADTCGWFLLQRGPAGVPRIHSSMVWRDWAWVRNGSFAVTYRYPATNVTHMRISCSQAANNLKAGSRFILLGGA